MSVVALGGERVTTVDDVVAIRVPDGIEVGIPGGTVVTIFHEMGGAFTVRDPMGAMFRIDGADAAVLGKDPPKLDPRIQEAIDGPFGEEQVEAVLRTCYDPEIPVDIVELGLIYESVIEPIEDKKNVVHIKMTLTAPGCGMGEVIRNDVRRKIEQLPAVERANVELVFDPPWSTEMMSEAARLQTGLM